MKVEASKTAPLKVTAVVDAKLLGSIERHWRELMARTGLQISTSAVAAQLLRAGLAQSEQQAGRSVE